jgi:hypothetical protein
VRHDPGHGLAHDLGLVVVALDRNEDFAKDPKKGRSTLKNGHLSTFIYVPKQCYQIEF